MIYCVAANKGGVGKTSLLTNVAALLSLDKRVLMVDCDGQGNCSLAFGINPLGVKSTLHDVLLGGCSIEQAAIKIRDNLSLIPSNDDMDILELEILPEAKEKYKHPYELLKPHLEAIKGQYDYIMIDTPPSLGLVTMNALKASDRVLIPFEPELYAVKGLIKVLETVEKFQEKSNPGLKVEGVVGMKVDSRTSLHSDMLQQARAYCFKKDINIYQTVIPRSIRFASATNYHGKPAVWVDKNNAIVKAYFELAKEMFDND